MKAHVAIKLYAGKALDARVTMAGLHRDGDYLMAEGIQASGL
jgi:hypothetical protein